MPGLTLIELLVTLALVALLVLAGLPALSQQLQRQQAQRQGWQLHSDLLLAQSMALSLGRVVRWAWLPATSSAPGCWWLMTGALSGCRCPGLAAQAGSKTGSAFCPGGAVLITRTLAPPWSLSATASSAAFDPVRGTVTPTFSLSLLQGADAWLKHIVNLGGRLRSCSDRNIAGWPPCT